MKEAFGAILGLVGFFGALVGAIALIRPIPSFRLPTRARALMLLIASLAITALAGPLLPPSGGQTETAQAEDSPPSPEPSRAATDRKAEVMALFRQLRDRVVPCEGAGAAAQHAAAKGETQGLYDALSEAKEVCKAASTTIAELPLPQSASGAERRTFKEALKHCEDGYYKKGVAFGEVAQIVNDGARPSDVSEARLAMRDAAMTQAECYGAFDAAAEKYGVPAKVWTARVEGS